MRLCILLLAVLLPACGVGTVGRGGGDEPMLPPPDAVPALEGTWCGPGVDGGNSSGAICVHIDAGGRIERLVVNGNTLEAVGTIQMTAEAGVFRFALSNGGAGFLLLSKTDQHLLYLDNTQLLAVLDSTSPNLPAGYLRSDIQDDWAGTSLFLSGGGDILGIQDSALSVLMGFGFDGLEGTDAFQEASGSTLQVTQAVFGRYGARYLMPGVTTGDVVLVMSPDKQCIGGTLCEDGGDFPDDCSIVIWERVP